MVPAEQHSIALSLSLSPPIPISRNLRGRSEVFLNNIEREERELSRSDRDRRDDPGHEENVQFHLGPFYDTFVAS